MRSHIKELHPSILEKKNKKQNSNKIIDKKQEESKPSLSFSRTFKCPICTVSYVREDSLRAHIRVHQRACNGQKGVVVVDTSVIRDEDPDDPEEMISSQEKHNIQVPSVPETFTVIEQQQQQQVVFYVPSVNNETNETILLSPNSGNNILEQLHLQQGVQYILVPSSATEGFETQVTTAFHQ